MKALFLALVVIVSLLVPWTEAEACEYPRQAPAADHHDEDSGNPDKAKMDQHCCCHHLADRLSPGAFASPFPISAATSSEWTETFFTSVVTGPLLEPPSHA